MAKLARVSIPRELPVAALVAAAGLPISRLFQPGGTTGVVLTSIVLSASISLVCRKLRVPTALALLISIGGLVWYVAGRFYPNSLFGPFPTIASFRAIADGIHVGVRQTIDEAVPVVASGPLLVFVSAGIWLTMWLADAAAVWVSNPLLAIASVIPLFATPGTLLPSSRRWIDTGLFLACAAWVLYSDERWRARRWRAREDVRNGWRPGPALRLGAIGVVLVVAIAPVLPGWGSTPLLQKKGPGARIAFNPFIAIKPTLRRQPVVPLFTVRTSRPTYFRLTTLDHFDGNRWSQVGHSNLLDIGSFEIPAFMPDQSSQQVRQHVRILGLAGQWIPASYDPVEIIGLFGAKIDADSRALQTGDGQYLADGTEFDIVSRVPDITQAALDQPFQYDRVALSSYLQLPSNLPAQVRQIADSVAGAEPTPFRKALALQDYLRTFTYDENVAAGHSFNDIVEFLTRTKRGYCEQFAGSMAVMARALGLPSRVAIGFGFGEQQGNLVTETTREAHAWVEIYFPTAGWVAFEPTPRAGVAATPAYATPDVAPSASDSVTPTVTPTQSNQSTAGRDPGLTAKGGAGGKGRPVWVTVSILAAAIVVGGLFTLAFFWGRRKVRRRRAHDVKSAVVVRYAEFLGWCASAGLGRRDAETPLEHATRLSAYEPAAADPLGLLADLVAEALWAPPNGLDPAEAARAAEAARSRLSVTLSRPKRILASTGWGRWRSGV